MERIIQGAKSMKHYCKVLFVGILLVGLAGCAGKPHLPDQPEAGDAQRANVLVEAYIMDVGDMVQINIWKNPELSVAEPIRPDGKISLPLIGDVMAAGLEPEELARDIEEKLSSYVKNPNVTVILTDLAGHAFLSRVRVTGSVEQDISITYHQGMTVLDAVLEAGSLDTYADGNRTKLYRRTKESSEAYDIRLDDIMRKGDMTTNVYLMPDDVISVPERRF
jgi:polysaccharide export outer membrane protein